MLLPLESMAIHFGALDLKIISMLDIGNSPFTIIDRFFLSKFQVAFGFALSFFIIIC